MPYEDKTNVNNVEQTPLSYLLSMGATLGGIEYWTDKEKWTIEQLAEEVRSNPKIAKLIIAPDEDPTIDDDNITPESFFDSRGKFLHNVMGNYLIKKCGVCKINNAIHIYENGVYVPGEEKLHGHMIRIVPSLSDARRREVYRYLKVNLDTPTRHTAPPHLIPFKSEIYDIENDRFIKYSPKFVFLNRFPYDYKPNAPEAKKVTDVLFKIACNDNDVVMLLLEAMGNCFYMRNEYRGAVFLYGQSGSNGKSTLLNMVSQLVGADNTSHLSLQDVSERFRLANIYGKAANIGDDIPDSHIPDSSVFKKLVTGEDLTAEKKGQDPFDFKSYAKMFFAMNSLPTVGDKSRAFMSRVQIVPLNNDFSKDKDVSLKNRDWTSSEMEWLTKLAVDGLKRLIEQGDFTRPACVADALRSFELDNNPVLAFLEEYGDIVGKPTQKVYDDYTAWCDRMGHKGIVTHNKFSREIRAHKKIKTKVMRNSYFASGTGMCFVNAD